jgi:hypothetical protein
MSFVLCAFLPDHAPMLSIESLAADLKRLFRNEDGFSVSFEKLPFADSPSLILRWDLWRIRVAYQEGDTVREETTQIRKVLGPGAPDQLPGMRHKINVVFGDNNDREYTNQIIHVMDFLRALPGAIIFDPQQSNFL